jgi:tetratricopeptide (TPR) repeat protein
MYYHAGKLNQAEEQLRKVIELDEQFVFGIWFLGRVYVAAGKRDQALAALVKAAEISSGAAWTRCMLGHAWAIFGEPAKAKEVLADLQDSNKYPYVRAIGVAMPLLGLGDREEALTWLEKGCNDRDIWALMMKVDPTYADLRRDTRFVALLRRMGLEQ